VILKAAISIYDEQMLILFVGATIGRPFFLFCGCLRAINDRPYEETQTSL
jgi:hypothetical protein